MKDPIEFEATPGPVKVHSSVILYKSEEICVVHVNLDDKKNSIFATGSDRNGPFVLLEKEGSEDLTRIQFPSLTGWFVLADSASKDYVILVFSNGIM